METLKDLPEAEAAEIKATLLDCTKNKEQLGDELVKCFRALKELREKIEGQSCTVYSYAYELGRSINADEATVGDGLRQPASIRKEAAKLFNLTQQMNGVSARTLELVAEVELEALHPLRRADNAARNKKRFGDDVVNKTENGD